MIPTILVNPRDIDWAVFAAKEIGETVNAVISSKGTCSIMLTGGITAERLYKKWAIMETLSLENIRFFFGDERCVPPDSVHSNYALVMRSLLPKGVPPGCSIVGMGADNPDLDMAARAYEEVIPDVIDVLLLGIGTDGHIASLFPHSPVLHSDQKSVVPVTGPKPPYERLTITPKVIASASSVFVLATGPEKGDVLVEALRSPDDFIPLPVRLTLGGTWILDDKAESQLLNRSRVLNDVEN